MFSIHWTTQYKTNEETEFWYDSLRSSKDPLHSETSESHLTNNHLKSLGLDPNTQQMKKHLIKNT